MDVLGVVGDGAVFCLAEDLVQHSDGDKAALDKLVKHISRAHAFQLVRVAHQQDSRIGADADKKLIGQGHIHHGTFVHDQEVGLQFCRRLLPHGFIPVEAQQTVQGLCVRNTRCLRHPPAGFSRGCPQADLAVGIKDAVCLDHRFKNRTFAGPGSAGDDRQIAAERHHNAFMLPL